MVVAIPARWASTRFPGKPLAELAGRPMILHVVERAVRSDGVEAVVVLTDDERIRRTVEDAGHPCRMTPEECASGTDRIAWAARNWAASAVVNVQGDEPLLDPAAIGRIARHLLDSPEDPMVTLAADAEASDLENPNAVKVVCDPSGRALYFSRAPIPWPRHTGHAPVRRHLGIYGYRRDVLLRLAGLEPTPLERTESLEQLRALENGIPIRVLPSDHPAPGVDTPEDLERVARLLAETAAPSTDTPSDPS